MKIAIVSDLHANLPATETVFDLIDTLDIDHCVCLGDLVGYYTQPLEIIDIIKQRCNEKVIAGNHDYIAINDNFKTESQYFNDIARKALVWTRKTIRASTEHWEYIKTLPLTLELKFDGYKFLLAHGTPTEPDDWEYFYYFGVIDQEMIMQDWLEFFNVDVITLGHTHVPFVYQDERKFVINPGSVGQPRDGDPRASFAVFDTDEHEVTHYRVKYQINKVISALRKENLPDILGRRLFDGR
ncbi:MAG: metallophosphoesterase family protein [Candidatus Thorarchaeota archaeon]